MNMRPNIKNRSIRGMLLLSLMVAGLSCNNDNELLGLDDPSTYINFDTNVSSVQTKATLVNNSNKNTILSGGAGVFGYPILDDSYVVQDDLLFDNKNIYYSSEDGRWTYDDQEEWPVGVSNILFYAYAPYISDLSSHPYMTNIAYDKEGMSLDYEIPSVVEDQIDLLISNRTYADIGGTVMLIFEHQLSAVQFQVLNNPSWKITKLTIENIHNSGSLVHAITDSQGTWTLSGEANNSFSIDVDYDCTAYNNSDLVSLQSSDQIFMMIPQILNQDARLKATIIDADNNSISEEEVELSLITNTVEWNANHIYSYTLVIGNGSISFSDNDIDIKDWNEEINVGFTESGTTQRVGYIDLDQVTSVEAIQTKLEYFEKTMVRKIVVTGTYWAGCFGEDGSQGAISNELMNYCPSIKVIDLEKMIMPEGTALPKYAFSPGTGSSNLTEVILPSTLTSVSEGLFYNCAMLSTINMSNISKIEDYALSGCSNLSSIRFENKTDNITDQNSVVLNLASNSNILDGISSSNISLELYIGRAAYKMYSSSSAPSPNPDDAKPAVSVSDEYSWAGTEWLSIGYFGDAGLVYDNNVDLDFYNTPESLTIGLEARVHLGYNKPVFYGDYYDGAFGSSSFDPVDINIPFSDMGYDYDWNNVATDHYICQPNTESPLFSVFNQLATIDLSNVSGVEAIFKKGTLINSIFSVDEYSSINKILFPSLNVCILEDIVFPKYFAAFNQHLSNMIYPFRDPNNNWSSLNDLFGYCNITDIGNCAFMGYNDFNFPYTYYYNLDDPGKDITDVAWSNKHELESIGDYAFFDCDKIKGVVKDHEFYIAETSYLRTKYIKEIGKGAFAGCDLLDYVGKCGSSLEYNDFLSVGKIGDYAFAYNQSMRHLSVSGAEYEDSSIGSAAFYSAGNKSIDYPGNSGTLLSIAVDGYNSIGDSCFMYSKLISSYTGSYDRYDITVYNTPNIGARAFYGSTIPRYYSKSDLSSYNSRYIRISGAAGDLHIGDECFANITGYFYLYIGEDNNELEDIYLGSKIFSGITQIDNTDTDGSGLSSSYIQQVSIYNTTGTGLIYISEDTFDGFDTTKCALRLPDNETISGKVWTAHLIGGGTKEITWKYIY